MHAGATPPSAVRISFGDGTTRLLHFASGVADGSYDARDAHRYAGPGRYTIVVRDAASGVLGTESVLVAPAPAAPATVSAPDASSVAPLIVVPGAPASVADPLHSGILVTPNVPATSTGVSVPLSPLGDAPASERPSPAGPAAASPAPARGRPAPGRSPVGRATIAPLAVPPHDATPEPTETPHLTTGDR